jgi:hypothetical protein
VTVEHSKALSAEFRAAGVMAEHLDGSTPLHVRAAILRRVDQGHTRVLCNVGVAIEGLDIPRLKCCVLARPTKSLARYLQMTGRVRRPWQGVKARIHDHAFVIKSTRPARRRSRLHAHRVLEGKLMSRRTEQTTYGPRYVYTLRAEKRDYVFPGTTHLNALLTRVQIPDSMVRITYLEEQPIGAGRSKKLFKVELDDGTSESTDPRIAEAGRLYSTGMLTSDVAAQLGVHTGTARKMISQSGVPKRSHADAMKTADPTATEFELWNVTFNTPFCRHGEHIRA